ncbi:hypothetical protein D4Q76_02150 [archaeon]|nr:MAG: hypothetical protein D4Q76_02150 [archaeon]
MQDEKQYRNAKTLDAYEVCVGWLRLTRAAFQSVHIFQPFDNAISAEPKAEKLYKFPRFNTDMDVKNRKWLLLISVMATAMFLFVFFLNISEIRDYESSSPLNAHQPVRIPIFYRLLLSPALLMIAAIFITYYLITRRLEEKLEKNMKIISRIVSKNNQTPKKEKKETDSRDIVLKFLNPGERKVLEMLIERKDAVLQSEISRMDGMTKLKTHRAVRDLERKGIIKIESFGKTNRIVLSKDIREVMFK